MDSDDIDKNKRRFLITASSLMGGAGLLAATTPFIGALAPNERVKAKGAPVEVDISELKEGEIKTVAWRGKPVMIVHRREKDIISLKESTDKLRDPESNVDQQPSYAQNPYRSIKEKILVVVGVCTHLGCTPKYQPKGKDVNPDGAAAFFCPCHGSKFDIARAN